MTILYVDDDHDDISVFCEAVETIDPSIICATASSSTKALEYLYSDVEDPDYVFLDINMPIMNGKQCLEKIRSNKDFNQIKVIMYSTTANPKEITELEEIGSSFLQKPNTFLELIAALSSVLGYEKNGV